MKLLIISILAVFPLILSSQNTEVAKSGKYSIGLSFSPDYCYRVLRHDASSATMAKWRDTTEIPKFGVTTGLTFQYKLSERLQIETGLQYDDNGYWTKSIIVISLEPDPLLPKQYYTHYSFCYLDIPIKVSYSFPLDEKFKLFVSAGLSANIFLS